MLESLAAKREGATEYKSACASLFPALDASAGSSLEVM